MSRQVANLRVGKIQSLIRRRGLTAEEFAKVDIRKAILRIVFAHSICICLLHSIRKCQYKAWFKKIDLIRICSDLQIVGL